jgi:hypothetical protein
VHGQNYVAVGTATLFAKDRRKSWQIAKTPLKKPAANEAAAKIFVKTSQKDKRYDFPAPGNNEGKPHRRIVCREKLTYAV